MKNKLLLLVWLAAGTAHAQVGIGTATPSPNAALDVTSASRGLLLPRLADTLAVRNPSAGLLIFNQKTKSAVLHDGIRWGALTTRNASTLGGPDSVTYTITGSGFAAGPLGAAGVSTGITSTLSQGGGGGGVSKPTFNEVVLTKPLDANTINFARTITNGRAIALLEVKLYKPGATTPYYSIKVTNLFITDYSVASGRGAQLLEQIGVKGTTIGFKDWVAGTELGWDISRGISIPY